MSSSYLLAPDLSTTYRAKAMKLTSKARKAIPKDKFALPGKRAYPIEDRGHAIAAKARAAEFATPSQKKIIDAKANKVIHGGNVKAGKYHGAGL